MKTVTQKARLRQAIIEYADKHGVTKAANRYEKVDWSAAGLEYDLCPIERFLRGSNPRIAETDPHVKGKMHGDRSRRP